MKEPIETKRAEMVTLAAAALPSFLDLNTGVKTAARLAVEQAAEVMAELDQIYGDS